MVKTSLFIVANVKFAQVTPWLRACCMEYHNWEGDYIITTGNTAEPRFSEVAGDRPNLFVNWRVRYIENLDITNLRGKDQNVRYIEVIVND